MALIIENSPGWVYEPQPTFEEWLEPRRQLDEEEDDDAVPMPRDEADRLIAYFSGDMAATTAIKAILSFTYGLPERLQDLTTTEDIEQRTFIHCSYLSVIAAGLPASHLRICELIEAAGRLRDDDFGLSEEQLERVGEWRALLRLEHFLTILGDYEEAMFENDKNKWINLTACWACMAVRFDQMDMLSTGYWHIALALKRNDEYTYALNLRYLDWELRGAAYWIMRAGPMLWPDRDEGFRDWLSRLEYLLDETKTEQHKEEFASYEQVTEKTWDMVRLALTRMREMM